MFDAQKVTDEPAFLQSYLNLKIKTVSWAWEGFPLFQIFTRTRNSVTPAIQDHFDSINATPDYCEEALPYLLALKQQNSDNYVESNICIISL